MHSQEEQTKLKEDSEALNGVLLTQPSNNNFLIYANLCLKLKMPDKESWYGSLFQWAQLKNSIPQVFCKLWDLIDWNGSFLWANKLSVPNNNDSRGKNPCQYNVTEGADGPLYVAYLV